MRRAAPDVGGWWVRSSMTLRPLGDDIRQYCSFIVSLSLSAGTRLLSVAPVTCLSKASPQRCRVPKWHQDDSTAGNRLSVSHCVISSYAHH